MPTKKSESHPKAKYTGLDALTPTELEQRVEQTLMHLKAARDLWPNLTQLEQDQRKRSLGRMVSSLGPALHKLFALLQPKADGTLSPLAKHFDALGVQDEGVDPEHFETELLSRRLARVEAEQQIVDALEDFTQTLRDDVLHTGELVIGPGLLALDFARSLAKTNETFRSMLAPVTDLLREMTKSARARVNHKDKPHDNNT